MALLALVSCTMDTVHSAEGRSADSVAELVLHEERRIGSVEDPDYGFSDVGKVGVDADGRIYVYEIQDREIRVYSHTGQFIRRIGRPGDGPGEFSGRTIDFGIYGDTLWIVEAFALRFTMYTTGGELIRSVALKRVSVPLHTAGRSAIIIPTGRDSDGLFIGDMGFTVQSGRASLEPSGTDTVLIPRVRFDSEGSVVDTVGSYPMARPISEREIVEVGQSRYAVPRPASSEGRYLATLDGTIRIDQTLPPEPPRIRVTRYAHDGSTIRSTVLRYEPSLYPKEVLDEMAANAVRRTGQRSGVSPGGPVAMLQRPQDSAAARVAIRSRLDELEYQSPVQGAFLTEDGTLWLRRENDGDPTTRWTVLNGNDVPVGEVRMPRPGRIAWIRGDRVFTVEWDSLDVPWLVAYRLRPK